MSLNSSDSRSLEWRDTECRVARPAPHHQVACGMQEVREGQSRLAVSEVEGIAESAQALATLAGRADAARRAEVVAHARVAELTAESYVRI